MGDKTNIEWARNRDGTKGRTWNLIVGCEHVSGGCDNCYAASLASTRLAHIPIYSGLAADGRFNGTVRILRDRLHQPLSVRKPTTWFVNSMSDWLHKDVPTDFIVEMFAVMAATPHHTYQLLTKRTGRLQSLLNNPDFELQVLAAIAPTGYAAGKDVLAAIQQFTWPLPNVWVGVSVEDTSVIRRVEHLLAIPAAVRFLSCEPLLGSLSLRASLLVGMACDPPDGIGWVIAGGESGRNARPMHPDWARRLRDQCVEAGVPFFLKQWGEWAPLGPLYGDLEDTDDAHMEAVALEVMDGIRVVELESDGTIPVGYQPGDERTWLMARVGKKAAGNVLDGQVWQQFPDRSAA